MGRNAQFAERPYQGRLPHPLLRLNLDPPVQVAMVIIEVEAVEVADAVLIHSIHKKPISITYQHKDRDKDKDKVKQIRITVIQHKRIQHITMRIKMQSTCIVYNV